MSLFPKKVEYPFRGNEIWQWRVEKAARAVSKLPVSEGPVSTAGLQALSCILLAGGRGAEHRRQSDRRKKKETIWEKNDKKSTMWMRLNILRLCLSWPKLLLNLKYSIKLEQRLNQLNTTKNSRQPPGLSNLEPTNSPKKGNTAYKLANNIFRTGNACF